MNLEDKNIKKKVMIGIGIAFVILVVVGTSLALWSFNTKQTSINELNSSCLKISLKDENDAITLEKAHPITNDEGEALTPYTFTIQNTCTTSISYNVNLGITANSTLNAKYIAVKLGEDKKKILNAFTKATLDGYSEAYTLKTGTLSGKDSITYDLRLWMDETTEGEESMNKTFESKIVISASLNELAVLYKEDLLNGADPVLDSEGKLVPVLIGDNGKVTKASLNSKWYKYGDKEWANAVILTESGKNKNYKEFDEILEEDIESYFVWIPKYSYKLWDLGKYDLITAENEVSKKEQEIKIKFGLTDTKDDTDGECTTPQSSNNSGNCSIGDWMTHPAFLAFGVNGLWVGKFETGYNQNEDNNDVTAKDFWTAPNAQRNENNSAKVIIKPNVYSWRNINVKNAFDTSYYYQRDLDSHMMKNTEWGVVAYLSHSKYGICENGVCKEIRHNNNAGQETGYASTEEPPIGNDVYGNTEDPSGGLGADGETTVNYTNPASQLASTTGNYTGIYDMVEGSWERVMCVTIDDSGKLYYSTESNPSGFDESNFPEDSKYYDTYKGTYTWFGNCGILGDATSELGPFTGKYNIGQSAWYGNTAYFPDTQGFPFLIRGGSHWVGTAGLFSFLRSDGNEATDNPTNTTFRIVLAPTK